MTKDQDQSTKLLSDYFQDGAKWGDLELSPEKLDALIKPELLEDGKLFAKVIPLAEHFYIHPDGKIQPFPTRGAFQKIAEENGWTSEKGRKDKKTVLNKSYRDMMIFEVEEFEAWLNSFSKEESPNPFKLRNGTSTKRTTQGGFTVAEAAKNLTAEQRKEAAAAYAATLNSRRERGKDLGNSRKASRDAAEQEDTKSKSKGKK